MKTVLDQWPCHSVLYAKAVDDFIDFILGIGLNFKINNNDYIVPMAVEEPSVIAAVSGVAKLISSAGGFTTSSSARNIIYAQIQLLDIRDDRIDSVIEMVQL